MEHSTEQLAGGAKTHAIKRQLAHCIGVMLGIADALDEGHPGTLHLALLLRREADLARAGLTTEAA